MMAATGQAGGRFPRLAVVGKGCIEDLTGGGITLGNLLAGWPPEHLGIVSEFGQPPRLDLSLWNYQLGSEEYRLGAPMRALGARRETSGAVTPTRWARPTNSTASGRDVVGGAEVGQRRRVVAGLHRYWRSSSADPLREIVKPLRLSENLRTWFRDFEPGIVYGQPSSLGTIRLLMSIRERTGIPLVIHMMDDWPAVAYRRGLLHRQIRQRTLSALTELVRKSEKCFAIGDAMAEQYQLMFGREFRSFQNCVALDEYRSVRRNDWRRSKVFRVAYRGRFGMAVEHSVLDVAECVGRLRSRGMDITFDIATPDTGCETARVLAERDYVTLSEPADIRIVPSALASADVLTLPYDFDPRSRAFIRLSIPTKLPEYLASGTPVLVYAPDETAVVRYARSDDWGLVVSRRDPDLLDSALARLYDDETLRRRLGEAGQAAASRNHDATVVGERFRRVLVAVAAERQS